MLISFKKRELKNGDKIEVYRNLHKNAFSVKNKKSNLVVAHGDKFIVINPTGIVNEKGRQRVISEKRKNVHAHIEGDYFSVIFKEIHLDDWIEITYDPYKYDSFVYANSKKEVDFNLFEAVLFLENKIYCNSKDFKM